MAYASKRREIAKKWGINSTIGHLRILKVGNSNYAVFRIGKTDRYLGKCDAEGYPVKGRNYVRSGKFKK